MIATDWAAPTTGVLRRLSDRRVQQYWDDDHSLAKQLAADARAPQPIHECCERSGILWDLAAVYPRGAMWTDRMPTAIVFNGPVVNVTEAVEAGVATPAETSRVGRR